MNHGLKWLCQQSNSFLMIPESILQKLGLSFQLKKNISFEYLNIWSFGFSVLPIMF